MKSHTLIIQEVCEFKVTDAFFFLSLWFLVTKQNSTNKQITSPKESMYLSLGMVCGKL